MANRIEKQKGAIVGISIAALVLGLGALVGGVILIVTQIQAVIAAISANTSFVGNIFGIIGGAILVVCGGVMAAWGVYSLWIGLSVKATKGSIAEDNLGKGTVNGKVCPKCGCTNTPDSAKCTACGTDL